MGDERIPARRVSVLGLASVQPRFRVRAAPGDLLLVQELLNTSAMPNNSENFPDLLDSPGTASTWFQRVGISPDTAGIGELRAVRDALRRALIARDDPASGADAAHVQVPSATITARIEVDGTVEFQSATDARGFRDQVLIAVHDAQVLGTWKRLKACRNPNCLVVFWDTSRNTSGVWHDTGTCGNQANLRASRARRHPAP